MCYVDEHSFILGGLDNKEQMKTLSHQCYQEAVLILASPLKLLRLSVVTKSLKGTYLHSPGQMRSTHLSAVTFPCVSWVS